MSMKLKPTSKLRDPIVRTLHLSTLHMHNLNVHKVKMSFFMGVIFIAKILTDKYCICRTYCLLIYHVTRQHKESHLHLAKCS